MIVLETLLVGCCQWSWTLGGGTRGWMFKRLLLSTSKEVSSCLCLVFKNVLLFFICNNWKLSYKLENFKHCLIVFWILKYKFQNLWRQQLVNIIWIQINLKFQVSFFQQFKIQNATFANYKTICILLLPMLINWKCNDRKL
jgi:hypothetical protein